MTEPSKPDTDERPTIIAQLFDVVTAAICFAMCCVLIVVFFIGLASL